MRDEVGNLFIRFQKSSYGNIDKKIHSLASNENSNSFLDTTRGYYTLDEDNKFVLAHYNWHATASDEKSQGIKDPKLNIPIINKVINKRIDRMLDLCQSADHILFLFYNHQGYDSMFIDDERYSLNDFEELSDVAKEKFGNKVSIEAATNESQFKDILMKYA